MHAMKTFGICRVNDVAGSPRRKLKRQTQGPYRCVSHQVPRLILRHAWSFGKGRYRKGTVEAR